MPVQNGSKRKHASTTQAEGQKGGNGLLQELKGAPLSVLLALEIYGAQGRTELMDRTGWGRNAVSEALVLLEKVGLVRRLHYRCWELLMDRDLSATLTGELAERPSGNLSATESPNGNRSAERPAGNLSGAESPPRNLSTESPKGNPSGAESPSGNLSESESPSHNLSAPHDHGGVIDTNDLTKHNKHHPSKTATKALAQTLSALDPPFDDAEHWLQEVSPQLVEGWLDYLEDLDRESRQRIRNEAAFLRWKVESEQEPPPPDKQREPCEACGKAIRDGEGRCLVCLGVVVV